MDLFLKLFDIRIGRFNRRQYWLAVLILVLINKVLGPIDRIVTPAFFLSFLISYLFMLTFSRRARDLNYSAWIPAIALSTFIVLVIVDFSLSSSTPLIGSAPKAIFLIIHYLSMVANLTILMMSIFMAFMPGTQGQNKHGLAPIGFNFRTSVEGGASLEGNSPDIQAPWRTEKRVSLEKTEPNMGKNNSANYISLLRFKPQRPTAISHSAIRGRPSRPAHPECD